MVQRETHKHKEAFWTWYELDRNYEQTRIKLGVNKDTLASWIKSFDWHGRATEIDNEVYAKAVKKLTEQNANRLTEIIENHLNFGEGLIAYGGQFLQNDGIENASQAIRAIQVGVSIQRIAVGLATELDKITRANDDPVAFTIEDWRRESNKRLEAVATQVNNRIPAENRVPDENSQ